VGIADSAGRIHDFAGSHRIGLDDFMTGPVTRFYRVDARTCSFRDIDPALSVSEAWDASIAVADKQYCQMM